MSEEYAPFPEKELTVVAHDLHVIGLGEYARIIESAVVGYRALNERCLRAELERDHGVAEGAG